VAGMIRISISFTIVIVIAFFSFAASCTKKEPEKIDTRITQEDIENIIRHKKNIDSITGKFDAELKKTKRENQMPVLEKGKAEINKYLESHGLDPVTFMRRSKKILKGYLAFQEASEEAIEKKMTLLEEENLTETEYQSKKEFHKKTAESLFKELTSELSDYEIELIRSNIKNLSAVMN
jgi:hypothetical protein